MYGRALKYKVKTEKLAELDTVIASSRAKMAKIPGVVTSCSMWNDDGTSVTFSIWESAAAAEAAAPQLKEIWEDADDYMASPTELQVFSHAAKLAG